MNLHINWTRYSETKCAVIDCPTCARPRRMLAEFQDGYGWTVTCAGCGDMWTDGEMHGRPFAPGWRRERIKRARAKLAEIGAQV
jgi:hypothetical protein